jgi:hypothetical protein
MQTHLSRATPSRNPAPLIDQAEKSSITQKSFPEKRECRLTPVFKAVILAIQRLL